MHKIIKLFHHIQSYNIQEDPFEESIVDFFETADTDKDGVIDINNFYSVRK